MMLQVNFKSDCTSQQVVDFMIDISDPQIILWYIGPYGYKEIAAHFYHMNFIHPILNNNKTAFFWLYDLTAWGAFKNKFVSINKESKYFEIINRLNLNRIKGLSSSEIFKKILLIKDNKKVDLIKSILKRHEIFLPSKDFPDIGIKLLDIFKNNDFIFSEILHLDASKAYSAIQYIEGLLLIEEIIFRLIKDSRKTHFEIVFVLPNDESKYYLSDLDLFEKHLRELLNLNRNLVFLKSIHVNFLLFKYGSNVTNRPYNDGRYLTNLQKRTNPIEFRESLKNLDDLYQSCTRI